MPVLRRFFVFCDEIFRSQKVDVKLLYSFLCVLYIDESYKAYLLENYEDEYYFTLTKISANLAELLIFLLSLPQLCGD